eukprot:scaffold1276_cov162-Amphora_coffeaeformis.AAC.6
MTVDATLDAPVARAAPATPSFGASTASPTMLSTDATATATAGVLVSNVLKQTDWATMPTTAGIAAVARIQAYDVA